jgi:3-hydroxyisobutyrate dehydrogenase
MAVEQTIGVIGLGQMGRGIAHTLDRSGLLRAAWDEAAPPRHDLNASATVEILSPAKIGAICDIVLFAVPGSAEIETCLTGAQGLFTVERQGQILIDLTTSHPAETRRLAGLAASHRRHYIDAGMSGGAKGADEGRLTLMVGADDEVFERAKPVLTRISSRLFHIGPVGAGHTMKLVHNMICHTVFLATAEGCRLAERAGLELGTVVEVLNAGNARSFITESRFPNHILSGTWDGRSRVSNLEKDLRMAVDLAAQCGAPTAYGTLSASLLTHAVMAGLADRDFTTLYRELDGLLASPTSSRA